MAITDINNSGRVAEEVAGLEQVSGLEVEQRARDVVTAAVEARRKEFVELPPAFPATRAELIDKGTGERYQAPGFFGLPGDEGWVNSQTGEVGDPRNIDPAQYQWVIDMFEYFHWRSPSSARSLGNHCAEARAAISSGRMSRIESVKGIVIAGWGGEAQQDFMDFFLAPFEGAVTTQQHVLDELACDMYAYEALLRQGQVDAKTAADRTIEVLEGLHGEPPLDPVALIKVAAVVAGVVGAIAGGGSPLIITAGVVAAAPDAAEVIADRAREVDLSGGTVDEVLGKLHTALGVLRQDMDTIEQSLADAVSAVSREVNAILDGDSAIDVGTILPTEPIDDVTNVTGGRIPSDDQFRPKK